MSLELPLCKHLGNVFPTLPFQCSSFPPPLLTKFLSQRFFEAMASAGATPSTACRLSKWGASDITKQLSTGHMWNGREQGRALSAEQMAFKQAQLDDYKQGLTYGAVREIVHEVVQRSERVVLNSVQSATAYTHDHVAQCANSVLKEVGDTANFVNNAASARNRVALLEHQRLSAQQSEQHNALYAQGTALSNQIGRQVVMGGAPMWPYPSPEAEIYSIDRQAEQGRLRKAFLQKAEAEAKPKPMAKAEPVAVAERKAKPKPVAAEPKAAAKPKAAGVKKATSLTDGRPKPMFVATESGKHAGEDCES